MADYSQRFKVPLAFLSLSRVRHTSQNRRGTVPPCPYLINIPSVSTKNMLTYIPPLVLGRCFVCRGTACRAPCIRHSH
jgi:hypothetical protein